MRTWREIKGRPDPTDVLLSKRSKERIDARIRELTPRNWGQSIDGCIKKVNEYLNGWTGFFGICTDAVEWTLGGLDAHIRRRLRAIQLKQWKRKITIVRRLIGLGVKSKTAWRNVYEGRKSIWKLSHTYVANRGLSNSYWEARGLVSLLGARRRMKAKRDVVSGQLSLF